MNFDKIIKLSCLLMLTVHPVKADVTGKSCARPILAHHVVEEDHKDLGGGIVLFSKSTSIQGTSSRNLLLVSCRSGKTLDIRTASSVFQGSELAELEANDKWRDYNVHEPVLSLVLKLSRSLKTFTLEQISSSVFELGARPRIFVENEEFCACAAFYPQLRGSKEPFQS